MESRIIIPLKFFNLLFSQNYFAVVLWAILLEYKSLWKRPAQQPSTSFTRAGLLCFTSAFSLPNESCICKQPTFGLVRRIAFYLCAAQCKIIISGSYVLHVTELLFAIGISQGTVFLTLTKLTPNQQEVLKLLILLKRPGQIFARFCSLDFQSDVYFLSSSKCMSRTFQNSKNLILIFLLFNPSSC